MSENTVVKTTPVETSEAIEDIENAPEVTLQNLSNNKGDDE